MYPNLMHAGIIHTCVQHFDSVSSEPRNASESHFDVIKILAQTDEIKPPPPPSPHSFCSTCEYVCNSRPKKKKGGEYNSYLDRQIRGAKDEKAQIPRRASVHPCIQWEPGNRPATGAALTVCGRTKSEAAGAVTAGVVVAHPAKIQVIEMKEGEKQTDICLRNHTGSSLISPLLLPSTLSPPGLPHTPHSSITDTHSLLSLHSPGTGTHTHSGDLHLAVLPLLQSRCIRD